MIATPSNRCSFLINPKAGKLRLNEKVDLIKRNFKSDYEIVVCESPNELKLTAKKLVKRKELVVACGGDGTINIVASEVIKNNGQMAILPLGRGNDFAANLGITSNSEAFAIIRQGFSTEVKYLILKFNNGDKKIALTNAGLGLLSSAAYRATKIPALKGKPLYLTAAIISLLKLKSYQYNIQLDGVPHSVKSIIIVVAGGKYTGGGLPIAPQVNLKKDKLNILIAREIGKLRALMLIKKVVTGSHIHDNHVINEFASQVEIKSESSDMFSKYIYGDGEYLGETPVKITIGQDPLNILVRRDN